MRRLLLIAGLLLLVAQVHAQQVRPRTTNYINPTDVMPSGGGEGAKSNNYVLNDTIGEQGIGLSRTANYDLNAGYRQTLENYISMACDPQVNLGNIIRTGDTSVVTCGPTGYCATNKSSCTVITDNTAGYTLSWIVQTGTGAAGSRTGTGYLNAFTSLANRIAPLGTGSTTMSTQPIAMMAGGTVNNTARWAGRLSSTSTTAGGAGLGWGSDGTSDKWLRVATGSAVNIANATTRTSVSGDIENIGFRVIIHGSAIVPNDQYKAAVTMTALPN